MDAGARTGIVRREIAERLEERAGTYWNEFYKVNANRFYKDRHWFMQEFGEHLLATSKAASREREGHDGHDGCNGCNGCNGGTDQGGHDEQEGEMVFLEVGCGTGSTIYPLLDVTGPSSRVFACDFAPEAVELVRRHPGYASGRVTVFTADITQPGVFAGHVPDCSVDLCMMVFVLSAISPVKMRYALENIRNALVEDGKVCFRDYARDDLCEQRMAGDGRQRMLQPGFYVRGDSTRCYYFTAKVLDGIFAQAGFEPVEGAKVVVKHELNRKTGEARVRRYIQGVYIKAARRVECADPFVGDKEMMAKEWNDAEGMNDQSRTNEMDVMNDMLAVIQHYKIGCLEVRVPSVRPVDGFLAGALCSTDSLGSSHTRRRTLTVELATEESSGVLSFALLQAAATRRHICCAKSPVARARMKRIFMDNASRFMWERVRVGYPDDVECAHCIALEWRADGGESTLGIAARLAKRTGAKIITACDRKDFEELLNDATGHGLALFSRQSLTDPTLSQSVANDWTIAQFANGRSCESTLATDGDKE